MTQRTTFRLLVWNERGTLMRVAAVFHRQGVIVGRLRLSPPGGDGRSVIEADTYTPLDRADRIVRRLARLTETDRVEAVEGIPAG